jgi:hypothetical protein
VREGRRGAHTLLNAAWNARVLASLLG